MAKICTVALRQKARKQGFRLTVKGEGAQLLEYNFVVNHWMPVDDYWGPLTHP